MLAVVQGEVESLHPPPLTCIPACCPQAVMHKVSAQMPHLVAAVALAVTSRLKEPSSSPEATVAAAAAPAPAAAIKTTSAPAPAAAVASPRAAAAATPAAAPPSAGRASVFSRLGPAPEEPSQAEAGPAVEAAGSKAARVKAGFTPYRPGSARKGPGGDDEQPPPGYGPEDRRGGERHPYEQTGPPGGSSRVGGGKSYLDR